MWLCATTKQEGVSEGTTSNEETARDHHRNNNNNRTEKLIRLPRVMLYGVLYAQLFLQHQFEINCYRY